MRILYYDWDEFNGEDCRDAMNRLGYLVDVIKTRLPDGKIRSSACDDLEQRLKRAEDGVRVYDAVFSFDFFPEVSVVCQKYNVPYVSWIFDCPHYPLCSDALANSVNRIHIFDRALWTELKEKGFGTVYHTPLAVNAERMKESGYDLSGVIVGTEYSRSPVAGSVEVEQRLPCTDPCNAPVSFSRKEPEYIHDVSFIGNLYDNEFNFYDQADFPEDIRSYLGDVFEAQQRIFGADIISDERVISEDIMEVLRHQINFENTGKFNIDYNEVILDILRKKITVIERRKILEELSRRFNTVVYTTPDAKEIPGVTMLGTADYMDRMPKIFHNSRININITMRCIHSGIPLRVMDVLAAGGFLLTSYTPEIEEQFVDGKELAIARTPEEMIEKTAYYLDHEEERKQIAINGQRKVFEKFAYIKILPEIFGKNNRN
jgi:spore maturation protein CgeB